MITSIKLTYQLQALYLVRNMASLACELCGPSHIQYDVRVYNQRYDIWHKTPHPLRLTVF